MFLFSEIIRDFSVLHSSQTESKYAKSSNGVVDGGFRGDKEAGSWG
jgi:hypothetical protein